MNEAVSRLVAPFKGMAQAAICNLYLRSRRPIPPELRSPYLLRLYSKALKSYRPDPYDGRILVLASDGVPRASQYWGKLAVRGLELYQITGDHTDVTEEPHVRFWAEKLKQALQTNDTHTRACSELSGPWNDRFKSAQNDRRERTDVVETDVLG
jgi:hypothetical protein